jgi:hypothetical protein
MQWRTLETSTHRPGALGSLVHKRVYTHTNGDATPNYPYDYVYVYDALGNFYEVLDGYGDLVCTDSARMPGGTS